MWKSSWPEGHTRGLSKHHIFYPCILKYLYYLLLNSTELENILLALPKSSVKQEPHSSLELFSLIPTRVEDTSKDPALAISDRLLGTVILQENVHTSCPGWRCNTIIVWIVPGSSNHTILISGVNLKSKEMSIRGVRDWVIKSSLTQQTDKMRVNIAKFRLESEIEVFNYEGRG